MLAKGIVLFFSLEGLKEEKGGFQLLTEQRERIQHVHAQERGEAQLQEVHDGLEHPRHGAGLRHEVLEARHAQLHAHLLRRVRALVDVLALRHAVLLRCCGEELGAHRLRHLGGQLLDKVLQERRELGVAALQLALGVGQERLEVVVGGGDPVGEVFEDEGESFYFRGLVSPNIRERDGEGGGRRGSFTCAANLWIPG